MNTLKLSLKNLTRQKRRNATLALAIAFGFLVVTFLDTFTTGIVGNLENQVTQLVGGTVLVQGLEKIPPKADEKKSTIVNIMEDHNYIRNIVEKSGIKYTSMAHYSRTGATLLFEGNKSIATIYGRELQDPDFIDSLQFIEGSKDNLSLPNSLIISEKTSDALNVHLDDTVILKTTTIYGQNTVEDFVVRGIVKGNSFISTIMAYTDIQDLNKIIELPEDGYSLFTVFLENKADQYKLADYIESSIRKDGNNVTSRQEALETNPKNIGKGLEKQITPESVQWDGVKYGVETLYDELPQLVTVFSIVHMVTFSILIVILLIVMVGVANTYKMVLFERIKEIGTMRALGMTGSSVKSLFRNEAVLLCIIGACAGLVLDLIVSLILGNITFTNEMLAPFLYKGHFTFKVSIGSILLQYLMLILFTILAVRKIAAKASKMSPAEALSTVK